MATCVCKQISACTPIPFTFNNISLHNPVNIDAPNICFRLIYQYKGIFDITYTNHKKQWINSNLTNNKYDRIDLLTIHSYNDAIAEQKEERLMKGVHLIGIQERNLYSMDDYVTVLQMFLNVGHLQNIIIQ